MGLLRTSVTHERAVRARQRENGAVVRVPRGTGGLAFVLVLTLAGGYAVGDLFDLLPGRFTLAPVPEIPDPFPTAPGAVGATELATALEGLSDAAPVPGAPAVTELVTELVDHEWLNGSEGVSVLVTDVTTGSVLAAHRETQARVPASTIKILTALAALDALGPEATLPTRVVRSAADRITLVGGGDMMLAADQGDPAAVHGRAGLGDLARTTASQLRLAGQTEVSLFFDDSLFTGAELHPTWESSYLNGGYVAPITPLAVALGARRTDVPYPPRFLDPARNAAEVFAKALAEQGIVVDGAPRRQDAPEGAQEIAVVHSATVAEITAYMLVHSENTVAEVLGRLAAIGTGLPGSFDGAAQAMRNVVVDAGLDPTGLKVVDASGLAASAGVPATVLAGLLEQVARPDGDPTLRQVALGLPVAALEGTLIDRFGEAPGAGMVRAKTGSLPGVTSLAGLLLTADDRELAFVVLADDTGEGGQLGPRKAIDQFVNALAACGCS
ncbi:MAG: D-alanyl-D-alanine carboxypeptidase/D-alanyl-D-alanine-endopeptidase [Actinomycetales bacterium]|nr:D-alanyl-D-alanine carboxypeptidase/D-alanyl-D-alanine-endopeptidase [Actinomycetales bacterium]